MGLALSIPPPLAGQMMTQQQRELQQAQENARGEQAVAANGHIVGIVSSTIAAPPFIMATGTMPQNINYAVKSDYARPLFEQPAPRPGAGSRAEAFERAKSATCRIEVDI